MINSISNFHTHTCLCGHAAGMPKDYIDAAKRDGCSELGFSDHCPYPTGTDTWPEIRMSEGDAIGYIASIREAAKGCGYPVKAGFECEWDKSFLSWYADTLLGNFGADYLVFGPHWVTAGSSHIYVLEINDSDMLNRYATQTIEGIKSGLFAFIAHPDLFMGRWREWDDEAVSVSSAIIDAAIDCNMPLEVNGLGLKRQNIMTKNGERHQYPYLEFWQLAETKGAKVICNSDAHTPQAVIEDARHAREFASAAGFKSIVTVLHG